MTSGVGDDGCADLNRLEQFAEMHNLSLEELTEAVNDRLGAISSSSVQRNRLRKNFGMLNTRHFFQAGAGARMMI